MPNAANPVDIHAQRATVQAFEVMCFAVLTPSLEQLPIIGKRIVAQVDFDGDARGQLRMELPAPAASAIAANFYGDYDSEISESQVPSLVAELTNIICGSLLSQLNPDSVVTLFSPELYITDQDCQLSSCYSFQMDEWSLRVSIAWEDQRKEHVA